MLKELIFAPRYGVYDPKTKTTTAFEYTDYGVNGFKIVATLELGPDAGFNVVQESLEKYKNQAVVYLGAKDLDLLATLLDASASGLKYLVEFKKEGITLGKTLTIDARKVQFIYEKYSETEYQLQLALTNKSSLKLAWSSKKLTGDFYFNLKRTAKEDVTTITGYTQFHLGNEKGAQHVVISAGIVDRKSPVSEGKSSEKVKTTYFQLQARKVGGLSVAEILGLVTPESLELPELLNDIRILNFAVLKSNSSTSEQLEFVLECHLQFSETKVAAKLNIKTEKKDGKTRLTIGARIKANGHTFRLEFHKTATSYAVTGEYISTATNVDISIKSLAETLFGKEAKEALPDLTITLTNPKLFFYVQKEEKETNFLFGAGAGVAIDLKELPLAGTLLVESEALSFEEVLVLYGKGKCDEEAIKLIKALPKAYRYSDGLTVQATILLEGEKREFVLGGGTSAPKQERVRMELEQADVQSAPTSLSKTGAKDTKWIKVDKKIGPVQLHRVGLAYHNQKVIARIDAAINTKSLSLDMMGLGLGFNLDWSNLDPDFYLDGLGLSYQTDAVEVSGALMRGTSNGIETFSGQARIKVKNFTISAVGSYAKLSTGESSLFIYGLFEGNIGGPPIFYVTGIAAGFGFNRKINAPELDEVADFPLVALAMRPDNTPLTEVLRRLEEPMKSGKAPIEIASGESWLALGVKFTSFKIIESFALLTVNFGTKTEFNVLGLSRLSWPEQSVRQKLKLKDPIVFVEIALKASFGPESELIKVDGRITSNSYILSRDCKLSGGFAFYTWVSGANSGDFVLTIGGYHPRFKKPEHYPIVPRVALNWRVSDELMVKGELYFAFTPSAIMLGGRWEMYYVTSVVKVAFMLWIDILMQWAPFYYDIAIGVLLRIEANIRLKWFTLHLNLELRAQLQIWGPPFSGIAAIDLGIYSFEIQFGSKETPNKKELEWNTFAEGFLPKEEKPKLEQAFSEGKESEREHADVVSVDCITTKLTKGVMHTVEEVNTAPYSIVNPMQMELVIDSAIPVSQLGLNGARELHILDTSINKELGVRPCGFDGENVVFDMQVKVELGGVSVDNLNTEEVTKGYPEALWGSGKGTDSSEPGAPKVIGNVLSGVRLSAVEPTAVYLKERDFSQMVETVQPKTKYSIVQPEFAPSEHFNTFEVYGKMKKHATGEKNRKALLNELITSDLGISNDTDLSSLSRVYEQPEGYFRGVPKMRKIGKEIYHPTDTV